MVGSKDMMIGMEHSEMQQSHIVSNLMLEQESLALVSGLQAAALAL